MSRPLVYYSSLALINNSGPKSSFIPRTIPFSFKYSTNNFYSLSFYSIVSENRMTPEIYFSNSGVVNNNLLYSVLLSSVDSNSIVTNFFSNVAWDSSAAKIPFPSTVNFLTVSSNSLDVAYFLSTFFLSFFAFFNLSFSFSSWYFLVKLNISRAWGSF